MGPPGDGICHVVTAASSGARQCTWRSSGVLRAGAPHIAGRPDESDPVSVRCARCHSSASSTPSFHPPTSALRPTHVARQQVLPPVDSVAWFKTYSQTPSAAGDPLGLTTTDSALLRGAMPGATSIQVGGRGGLGAAPALQPPCKRCVCCGAADRHHSCSCHVAHNNGRNRSHSALIRAAMRSACSWLVPSGPRGQPPRKAIKTSARQHVGLPAAILLPPAHLSQRPCPAWAHSRLPTTSPWWQSRSGSAASGGTRRSTQCCR